MTDDRERNVPDEAEAVLRFWFGELDRKQWWKGDIAVDRIVADRFRALHDRLAEAVPQSWLGSARGRLAAVIVLDQFPRNLFRDASRAFATDPQARALARETVELGLDAELTTDERLFLYLPFEHSEDAADQARSVELYRALGDAEALEFADKHKQIIDRFGRFPHRNAVLGRETTDEEWEFLKEHSWFW